MTNTAKNILEMKIFKKSYECSQNHKVFCIHKYFLCAKKYFNLVLIVVII